MQKISTTGHIGLLITCESTWRHPCCSRQAQVVSHFNRI